MWSWTVNADTRACDVQETTSAVAPETTTVVAPCSKTANAFAAVAPPPAAGKEDPFSTAAERSFVSGCTCQPWLPGRLDDWTVLDGHGSSLNVIGVAS